jgi:xylulokinase
LWEQDPEEIWQATNLGMSDLMQEDSIKHDPPVALAISASGRENFPADSNGKPLGNGIMGADIRGAEFEILPEGSLIPEPWFISRGHLRERMDPVFRLMWWQKYHPELMAKAKFFLGWHDFLSMRICGQTATDQSTASRYLVYDLNTLDWSQERITEFGVPTDLLPQVLPWPAVIGDVKPDIAEDWGMPAHVKLTLGGHDVNCEAVGAGVTETGEA